MVSTSEQGAPTLREQTDAREAELERGVRADPLVQAVLQRFPGAKIVGVTPKNAPERQATRCPTDGEAGTE